MQPKTITYAAARGGLFVGSFFVLFEIAIWLLNLKGASMIQNLNLVILIIGIIYFTQEYRDKVLGGAISYGQALRLGLSISFFTSILVAFFTYIQFRWIDSTLAEKILDLAEQQMIQSGESDVRIDQALDILRKVTTPFLLAISTVFSVSFWGFLFSLVSSYFLKREVNPFQDNSTPSITS